MTPFSSGQKQSPTILEHIRAHLDTSGCGLLPGGEHLPRTVEPDDTESKWAPGAWEGVLSHHAGRGVPEISAEELVWLLGATIASNFQLTEFGRLYERIRDVNVLSCIDDLLPAIRSSALPPAGVLQLAWRLATEGRDVDPVKLGIALFNLFPPMPEVRELLLTLGRSEELTLYCAVALGNTEADPETVLWALARSVDGWGRIHTVEQLRGTQHPEIQDWLLREGFRNTIMNEYLAFKVTVTGRLLDRLSDDPDDELLDSACDIVSALIAGGPAESIDDYADTRELLSVLLRLLESREPRLRRFVVVDNVRQFLLEDDGWEFRYDGYWTPQHRSELVVLCDGITSHPRWRELAEAGLESDDYLEFWSADRAAQAFGLDSFPAHLRRIERDPAQANWYVLMQLADDSRINQVVELAERILPLDEVATGPGKSHGLGPEYVADSALFFILQDLGRFPGRGWNLVRVGLRGRVLRNRNMALKTLREWPRAAWPPDAVGALQAAAELEPHEKTRDDMHALLAL